MSDPYDLIQDFFSALSLARYRKYISCSFQAALSKHYWKREDPGSLLYFQKKMEDLIDAANLLLHEGEKPESVLSPEVLDPEIIDPGLYMIKRQAHTQWEVFPRSLSRKEFLNPYLVFKRFFRYKNLKDWQDDFKEIIFYAFTPYSCAEDLADLDLLKFSQFLQKLVEAAHLILVREISADPKNNE